MGKTDQEAAADFEKGGSGMRHDVYGPEIRQKVLELYNKGHSQAQIAELVGILSGSVSTIMQRLRHEGKAGWRFKRAPEEEKSQKPGTVRCTMSVSKKCLYGMSAEGNAMTNKCNYILMEGHSRGCPWEECTKFTLRGRGENGNKKFIL